MKKGFLNILAITSFLVAFFLLPKTAYAATFKVEKSIDAVKPGQDVTVYIKSTDIGSDPIESYSLNLTYDASKLDLKSHDNGNGISTVTGGNPITITKNGGGAIDRDNTTAAVLVFTAKNSPGDANLTLTSSECKTSSGKCKEPQSSMVKIASYSNDATLSSLKIPNATISPKFDKNVTEYSTTITDITEITVNAIATDSNAKIMISDNYKNLQKGDNEIKITVTAENGKTTKTYIIKVKLKLTPTDEEVLKANAYLSSLKIDGFDLNFTKELKKYSLSVPYKVTKLKINAEAENPKAIVQIDGNKKLNVGRNIVKIDVTSEDEQNKETYTLNVTREKQVKKVVQTCPDTTSKREWIFFSISMLVTFTFGILLGYYLSKKEVLKKLFKKSEKKENKEEKLEDTIKIPNVKKASKK